MNRVKPEKNRVFLACIVIAAMLALFVILRTRAANKAANLPEVTAQALIEAYAKKQDSLKLTVAVIDGEETAVSVYGEDGAAIQEAGGRYEIGSLTKTFVGALFGEYAAEGKVSLSDPVSSYVDFGGKYDPTLLELLTHTSAYEDYRTNGFFQTAKYRLGRNPYGGVSSDRVPVYMKRFSAGGQPPYEYGFSNFGYAVLGKVVESVEGRPFAEVMEAYVRDELGLKNTGFAFDDPPEDAWKWQADDAFLPSAGLCSDIDDLSAWVRLYFEDGIDEGRTLAVTPQKKAEGSDSAALGWGVRYDGIVGHGGSTSHYSSQILMDCEKGRAVILLSNEAESNGIALSDIAKQLYSENFE